MDNNAVKGSVIIKASAPAIWEVLTHPDKVVLYTGSRIHTDWTVDSPITWEGEMHGKKFQNKGKVLENIENRLLRFTYWSGMGGDQDLPENYSEITYTLDQMEEGVIELGYSRVEIATSMEQQIFEQFLPSMLEEIKKLAEK